MTQKETTTKILLCEPVPERSEVPPHRAWWLKILELVARLGTTLDFMDLRKGYVGLSTYEQSYNGIQMSLRAYEAEK